MSSPQNNQPAILFINLAKGLGGGEVQTALLMQSLSHRKLYFYGKSSGQFIPHLRQTLPNVQTLTFWQMLRLVMSKTPLIIHAHDGRGAHLAGWLKTLSGKPMMITRHVAFPLKRQSSQRSYRIADALVGVSQQVSQMLTPLNPNTYTIYGAVKPLSENDVALKDDFQDTSARLRVAHIGNLQSVKNFPLTIELAKHCPDIQFYIVGSGELEKALKQQAMNLPNVRFIPRTEYLGSIFKQIDLQILPSESEGLAMVILEGYQYRIPVLAHAVGGIPEIVQDGKTGFLIQHNQIEAYQSILAHLNAEQLTTLQQGIDDFLSQHDCSATHMAEQYELIYQKIASDK